MTAVKLEEGLDLSTFSRGIAYESLSKADQNKILVLQQRILHAVALGGDALVIAAEVCRLEERLLPNSVGSVMLLDDKRELLNVFAAPSVPQAGIDRLNGLRPGPGGGSCGNAVFSGKPQFVGDTHTDPRWADLRQVAYDLCLCSCWSMPIYATSGEVVGSFALSSFEHRMPTNFHKKLLEIGASIIGIVLERSRTKENLRLYEKFYQGSEEGMLITDATPRIVSVNQSFLDIFGYQADEVLGQNPSILSSGRHGDAYYQRMWDALRAQGAWRGEIWNRRKNGQIFPELLSITALKDNRGNCSHFIGIFADLTERVRAETELKEKNEQLRQANAELERFAYVSSHDLQTPLRNMVHFAQLLERKYKGKLDGEADEYIRFIVDGGKFMSSLVKDIVGYARAGTGNAAMGAVDAGQAAGVAVGNLDGLIRQLGATVQVAPLPHVMGELSQLTDVFQNLIHNALKYHQPGRRPEIQVSVDRQQDGLWRFCVADNGIGIDPLYFEKIFELFQRLDPRDDKEGTGIGLSVCRRVVHGFGGVIWVDSTPGQGSRFYFTLRGADTEAA